MHEFELIRKYFSKLSKKNLSSLNLNDDVFFDKKKNLVVSTDTYNQNVHFIDFKKPDLVIKKIIRSSISDLICKGVLPKYYFISASGNKKYFSSSNLRKIFNSLNQEQKKYKIILCGGDTVNSKTLSFTITSIGFSKNIVFRNKAKLNDNIYVTGNLGDSYLGLKVLSNKIKIQNRLKKYFIQKYFLPDLPFNLTSKLSLFANSSIDISDGLITDLEKLINSQKLSYKLKLKDIPISKNLKKLIDLMKLEKKKFISNGDDYQILFTANPSKSKIIKNFTKSTGTKITLIGKICSPSQKSQIIDQKGNKITIKNTGYYHRF